MAIANRWPVESPMLTSADLACSTSSHPRLSIIVPTLNEEASLRRVLQRALEIGDEVIVSDGGSSDQTLAIARSLGVTTVSGTPGRGVQLNRGAAGCETEILLFLHADTELPSNAGDEIRTAVANGAIGGGFHVVFDNRRPLLRLGNRLVAWRTSIFSTPLGDQAQFVLRHVFTQLGGYREWPILEDLDFARRLKRRGPLKILAGPATTAARRFVGQGILRTVLINWTIWFLYWVGISPHRLARLYRQIR